MTCSACEDRGLVPFVELANPKPDDAITVDDLWFALCLCERGRTLRETRNAGRDTGYALWHIWAAQQRINPARVCRLEDAYGPAELQVAGFNSAPSSAVRESALLALGKDKRVKL